MTGERQCGALIDFLCRYLTDAPSRKSRIMQFDNKITKSSMVNLNNKHSIYIYIEPKLTDDRVTSLFAMVSRALAGDERFGNINIAIATAFASGGPSENNMLGMLLKEAMQSLPEEEDTCGYSFNLYEREQASLGAMGAAQWTGRWRTRPHSLLVVKNMTSVDDWKKPLPRGVRRTLKKALQQNFTVTTKYINGDEPAPHSSLAHFRCVVEHEVRLLSGKYGVGYFFDSLGEAISRYVGTTRMAGVIHEYRSDDGKVIAFAHEVRKGRTIRGQWFYATDEAAKNYVWFHAVHDLVERAISADDVDVVDLGPSGSDAFTELKERYGFMSIDDWPAVADYLGPFHYPDGVAAKKDLARSMIESLFRSNKDE